MTIRTRPPWWEDEEWARTVREDWSRLSRPSERKADDQPREPAGSPEGGQFASADGGGGGGAAAGGTSVGSAGGATGTARVAAGEPGGPTSKEAADRGRETGKDAVESIPKTPGRENGSGSREDPIAVGNDLERAVREIYAGNHIRLDQPAEVATLIDKLGDYAEDAVSKGEAAPTYDLGKVSVAGTNLFTQESLGIPRVAMPQLDGVPTPGSPADDYEKDAGGSVNLGPQFRDSMEDGGFTVKDERVSADNLRATQMDLKGPQVAGMSRALEEGTLKVRPIFVSKDNYVVDGHHQWAATVLANLRAGEEKFDIPVQRVDADIGTVLDAATEFTTRMGIAPKAGLAKTVEAVKRLVAWMAEADRTYNHAQVHDGRWESPRAGLKTHWEKHREQLEQDARLEERVRRYRISLFED